MSIESSILFYDRAPENGKRRVIYKIEKKGKNAIGIPVANYHLNFLKEGMMEDGVSRELIAVLQVFAWE